MNHTDLYQQHFGLLSGLNPAYYSYADIERFFNSMIGSTEPNSFDNVAVFESDIFRTEILNQTNAILTQYQGSMLVTQHDKVLVEKDLLWSTLQIYARAQAIRLEIGVALEPQIEYEDCLKKLKICKDLLEKNNSFKYAHCVERLSNYLTELHKTSHANASFLNCGLELKTWEAYFAWFIKKIDKFNETRLFWVWGRPNLDLTLGILGQSEAQAHLADTTYLPGQVSWSLYLFRGSLFFLKFMRKRFSDPKWLQETAHLSEEERAKYRARYVRAYWNIFKYRILNDYVWGPINLAGFKWWYGSGFYGWMNDFSTCFLLCMDIYLSDLTFEEDQKVYIENSDNYKKKLTCLSAEIQAQLKKTIPADQMNDLILAWNQALLMKVYQGEELDPQEQTMMPLVCDWIKINNAYQAYERNWQQKSQFLIYDRMYAKALLVVFALCVSFLIPGFLPIALNSFLSTSGTILCLASTIVYRSARAQLKITHCQENKMCLKHQEAQYYEEFVRLSLIESPHENTVKRMQALYLMIVKIGAQINYETATMQYERLELARTTFLRFFIPILVGIWMVYAPVILLAIPSYFFVLAASAFISYGLDKLVKHYKPNDVPEAFSLNGYQKYVQAPKIFSTYSDSLFANPRENIYSNDVSAFKLHYV